MDLHGFPFASRRMPLLAGNGVVATSQPLAAQAGLRVLRRGGNAVDAAVATAITLTVVEPTSNGIGGDAFAMVWDGERLHGLNGSGRAPAALDPAALREAGHAVMPGLGWAPVTVPGAPAAWWDLHARFGALDWDRLFEDAVSYAREGFPVSPVVAENWQVATREALPRRGAHFAGWAPVFAPGGRAPRAGERWSSPDHARTLAALARDGARVFYEGALCEAIARFARETGGLLSAEDLSAHRSEWVEPLSVAYSGHRVWELPPNGQGIAALMALGLADGLAHGTVPPAPELALHRQIECMKLAFADAYRHVADPAHSPVPVDGLLDASYLATRRALVGERAGRPVAGMPPRGGTVYLCTADGEGRMVSFIQSNYTGFGSGIVVPGTGIALHNRGAGFSLEPGHPNEAGSRRRPFHTIMPGFLTGPDGCLGPFGVMGAAMQPQGHLQVASGLLDAGLNPQAALDAPRWRVQGGVDVDVEAGFPDAVLAGLRQRGHRCRVAGPAGFGRGQIIWRLGAGSYVAGSDPRADGVAAGW